MSKGAARSIAVVCVVAAIVAGTVACGPPPPRAPRQQAAPAQPASPWLKAGGNIWSDIKLYYGSGRNLVGTVVGGNEHHRDLITGDTYRGVLIDMAGGSREWKNRGAIISGDWWVRADDPALKAQRWQVIR